MRKKFNDLSDSEKITNLRQGIIYLMINQLAIMLLIFMVKFWRV
jgi:hypothetical protein